MARLQNVPPTQKTDWETPPELMKAIEGLFGKFMLDPCASPNNAQAPLYYSLEQGNDGLEKPWIGSVYVNPPYGRGIGEWVKKCWQEVRLGYADLVVALLPVSPDTAWWQETVPFASKVLFLKGRVTFVGAPGPAPFASAVVVWRRGERSLHQVLYWNWKDVS